MTITKPNRVTNPTESRKIYKTTNLESFDLSIVCFSENGFLNMKQSLIMTSFKPERRQRVYGLENPLTSCLILICLCQYYFKAHFLLSCRYQSLSHPQSYAQLSNRSSRLII